jgi:Class II flagellar assembly regulator
MRGIGRLAGGGKAAAARGVGGGSRGGGSGREGFTLGLAASGAAQGPERAMAVASLGFGLLGLQESGEEAARDQAAARRANFLLDELQGLQADLLGDGANPLRLARLAALGEGDDGADPGLRDAVQAIALRARIELARRGWPQPMSSA